MYKREFDLLNSKKGRWVNEEEVRLGWVIAINSILDLDLDAERGKKDLSYNNVVIEFKDKGLFKGKISSPSFKEAIYERLLPYILKTSKSEGIPASDYIGIAIDGENICFAQVIEDKIEHGHLLPFSEVSFGMVLTALKDSYRRALIAENLIDDFGHSSLFGAKLMKSMADALASCLNDANNSKTKMLFEEWKTLFGQVADLSIDQIKSINTTLQFKVNVPAILKIPSALFVLHTYNSLIIKLLAAEIISAHKLTSYHNFCQNLSVESDDQIFEVLTREIEHGHFYSSAGIHGFVEEALFSWYLDFAYDYDLGKNLVDSIRQILVKLSFYRSDNLTEARSKDLLKLFYQNLVPETLRKSLGEFYTPDWLVSFTLNKAGKINWLENRSLDPTCGSGSFLIEIIKRKIAIARQEKWESKKILNLVTTSVWGFDLNPLAVQTARVNFLIAIAQILKEVPGEQIEVPILLADAIYSPARNPKDHEDVVRYTIGSEIANLDITIPSELAFDRKRLDKLFEIYGECIEENKSYSQASEAVLNRKLISKSQTKEWHDSLSNTYNKVLKLHENKWNGIWFRIIRNFFWSATAGKFDLIAGNPPWVRWSKLPELYRERVKPTCMNYNIFSSTPHHGGNELDISGMITYTVADKWLENDGTLAFIITQTHFQSPSSEGFRDFKINDSYFINPQSVDDMKEIKPFPDATNKTAVTIFKKQYRKKTKYPVAYNIWNAKAEKTRAIPVASTLKSVFERIECTQMEANPVTARNSPWAILPKGRFREIQYLAGKCDWVQGRKGITADLNGIYFVNILEVNDSNGLVKIRTRPEAGRINIGPAKEHWVEADLLFPLVKGASDFQRCFFSRDHELFAFVPNDGIIKSAYDAARTKLDQLNYSSAYFKAYKKVLSDRSTLKGRMKNAPFFAIYNVGHYTFARWKVIWAEQKDFCAAVVSSHEVPLIGNRPFVPDHKVFFVEFTKEKPAYYLCGLLNSEIVIEFVKSHNISIQIGDVFKHMNLPDFDLANHDHISLANLAKRCHKENNIAKRDVILKEISKLSHKIITSPNI